jgi:hypothetical protein
MSPILKTTVLGDPVSSVSYPANIFFLGYRGSIAHGMFVPQNNPDSIDDIDLMGFVFGEPRHYFGLHEWGSRGTREIKQGQYDVVLYEARKAVSLLLHGNPNIMSMLWIEPKHRLIETTASRTLLENRNLFAGRHVYNAFAGYAYQQLTKMETCDPAELRGYLALTAEAKFRGIHPNHKGERIEYPESYDASTGEARNAKAHSNEVLLTHLRRYMKKGENIGYLGDKRKQLVLRDGYDSKNAAHLIRLLRMCIEFMSTGEMIVERPDAEELLSIKAGKWPLADVKTLSDQLFADARAARDRSPLPPEPNHEEAEKLLISIVRDSLNSQRRTVQEATA